MKKIDSPLPTLAKRPPMFATKRCSDLTCGHTSRSRPEHQYFAYTGAALHNPRLESHPSISDLNSTAGSAAGPAN